MEILTQELSAQEMIIIIKFMSSGKCLSLLYLLRVLNIIKSPIIGSALNVYMNNIINESTSKRRGRRFDYSYFQHSFSVTGYWFPSPSNTEI